MSAWQCQLLKYIEQTQSDQFHTAENLQAIAISSLKKNLEDLGDR